MLTLLAELTKQQQELLAYRYNWDRDRVCDKRNKRRRRFQKFPQPLAPWLWIAESLNLAQLLCAATQKQIRIRSGEVIFAALWQKTYRHQLWKLQTFGGAAGCFKASASLTNCLCIDWNFYFLLWIVWGAVVFWDWSPSKFELSVYCGIYAFPNRQQIKSLNLLKLYLVSGFDVSPISVGFYHHSRVSWRQSGINQGRDLRLVSLQIDSRRKGYSCQTGRLQNP